MTTLIYDFKLIDKSSINEEIKKINDELKKLYKKLGPKCDLKILSKIEELEIILKILERNVNR